MTSPPNPLSINGEGGWTSACGRCEIFDEGGMDARGAGVIDLARGMDICLVADVRYLARGKDARGAGVIDLARGMDICLWQM